MTFIVSENGNRTTLERVTEQTARKAIGCESFDCPLNGIHCLNFVEATGSLPCEGTRIDGAVEALKSLMKDNGEKTT